jgi:hypothetical protein
MRDRNLQKYAFVPQRIPLQEKGVMPTSPYILVDKSASADDRWSSTWIQPNLDLLGHRVGLGETLAVTPVAGGDALLAAGGGVLGAIAGAVIGGGLGGGWKGAGFAGVGAWAGSKLLSTLVERGLGFARERVPAGSWPWREGMTVATPPAGPVSGFGACDNDHGMLAPTEPKTPDPTVGLADFGAFAGLSPDIVSTCREKLLLPTIAGAAVGWFVKDSVWGVALGAAGGAALAAYARCGARSAGDFASIAQALIGVQSNAPTAPVTAPQAGLAGIMDIIDPPAAPTDTPLQRATFRVAQVGVSLGVLVAVMEYMEQHKTGRSPIGESVKTLLGS